MKLSFWSRQGIFSENYIYLLCIEWGIKIKLSASDLISKGIISTVHTGLLSILKWDFRFLEISTSRHTQMSPGMKNLHFLSIWRYWESFPSGHEFYRWATRQCIGSLEMYWASKVHQTGSLSFLPHSSRQFLWACINRYIQFVNLLSKSLKILYQLIFWFLLHSPKPSVFSKAKHSGIVWTDFEGY